MMVIAASLAACGGGSSGSTVPQTTPNTAPPTPFIVAGASETYTGTDSIALTYPSGSSNTNYTASYTLTEAVTVTPAPSGAPGPLDVHNVTTFTTVSPPPNGTQKQTTVEDDYVTQPVSGSTLSIEIAGSKTVTTGTDVTAQNEPGAPYTIQSTVVTANTMPIIQGVYPLATGAVYTEPFQKTVATTTTDQNAAGTQATATFAMTQNDNVANDSSYTRTQTLSNGEQPTFTETPSGTLTVAETGPLFTLSESIDAPTSGPGGYIIPITETKQNAAKGATPAPSATPMDFSAADWYPGNAAPSAPLGQETVTVKGLASSLPSGCAGAISEPNVYELDEAFSLLNVNGSYETIAQQRFVSNGIAVCTLTTTTTNAYTVTTGALASTTVETRSEILTGVTSASASASARSKP